jgi:hypothetical protein
MIIDIDANVIYLEAILHDKKIDLWSLKLMINIVYLTSDLLINVVIFVRFKCIELYLVYFMKFEIGLNVIEIIFNDQSYLKNIFIVLNFKC